MGVRVAQGEWKSGNAIIRFFWVFSDLYKRCAPAITDIQDRRGGWAQDGFSKFHCMSLNLQLILLGVKFLVFQCKY